MCSRPIVDRLMCVWPFRVSQVCKLLQNAANGVLFGVKEPYMLPVNAWVAANTPVLRAFLDRLCHTAGATDNTLMHRSSSPTSVVPLSECIIPSECLCRSNLLLFEHVKWLLDIVQDGWAASSQRLQSAVTAGAPGADRAVTAADEVKTSMTDVKDASTASRGTHSADGQNGRAQAEFERESVSITNRTKPGRETAVAKDNRVDSDVATARSHMSPTTRKKNPRLANRMYRSALFAAAAATVAAGAWMWRR